MKHVANGTGPFKLKQFSRGVVFHMVKNEGYFLKGLPYLDEYKIYLPRWFVIPARRSEATIRARPVS
ncbi:MAG: hypothetical protein HYX92_22225 [Chloroflexi bacterium]|nr:hypothetical protein [Chloroflexota bacterium]